MKIIITRKLIPDEDADLLYWDAELRKEAEAALLRGEWSFIGIVAEAELHFPYGQDTITSVLRSPGLWGVQSHSGEEYLNEIFLEEVFTLKNMIAQMQAAPVEYEIKGD